jgi:hypothetical protein
MHARAIFRMDELKEILKLIVADLERSAAAINTLQSGSTERLTALELGIAQRFVQKRT